MVNKIISLHDMYRSQLFAVLQYTYQYNRLDNISQYRTDNQYYGTSIQYYYDKGGNKPTRIDDESGIQLFDTNPLS
jgi:hypothetical protein